MKVLVAMSGGVDSAVAAARLVDDGHQVVGVTMRLWGGESDTGCCSVADVDDARRVADRLGIDHHVFNFSEEFDRHVVEPYVRSHASGGTPNPCIECNRHLKFDALTTRAAALGFEAVATGHHARLVTHDGRPYLARGVDAAKDQSYVLYPLAGDALSRVLLPIGELTKDQVRAEAARRGLRVAAKADSQDVCFISRVDGRRRFLERRIPLRPATVVEDGEVVGRLDAVQLVTVGQRRGLDLAGGDEPRYVIDVDAGAGVVRVGRHRDLLRSEVRLDRVVWAHDEAPGECRAQVGAHGAATPARVTVGGAGTAEVRWDRPRPRVAPGQSVVMYHGDRVVGGGIALS